MLLSCQRWRKMKRKMLCLHKSRLSLRVGQSRYGHGQPPACQGQQLLSEVRFCLYSAMVFFAGLFSSIFSDLGASWALPALRALFYSLTHCCSVGLGGRWSWCPPLADGVSGCLCDDWQPLAPCSSPVLLTQAGFGDVWSSVVCGSAFLVLPSTSCPCADWKKLPSVARDKGNCCHR